jgi:putative DNA primase/helicase
MNAKNIAEFLTGRKISSQDRNFVVPCPAHDDTSPSLSLRDGDRGLMVHCFAGCAPADVYRAIWRRNHHLLEPNNTAPDPATNSSEYERRQRNKAGWLWSQRKRITGTAAEKYLRQARGYPGPLPPTLAFLPARKPDQHPALIAAFALVDEQEPGRLRVPRDVGAVHVTLLRRDGLGKADTKPAKLVIGSPGGRPIVVAPPNDHLGLAITEGIEDGLTAHKATGLGVWAAGSAGFMPKLAENVPSYIEAVTIYAHDDQAGRDGARKLAARLNNRGIEVRIEGVGP